MTADLDVINPRRILIVAPNAGVNPRTGWPVGFWWSELTHPYWEFMERGYEVELASPSGGALVADPWSDPRDSTGYSEEDLISLGFINSPRHLALVENTRPLAEVDVADHDAVLFVGGQSPMITFIDDQRVHDLAVAFHQAGKVTAVVCHATCILLRATLPGGELLVTGKTWTGFANSEEDYADAYGGQTIQPFRIEDEARKLPGTNFVVNSRFRPYAVRDGLLITGQQQYSGAAAARLMIEALGR
ncbi:type 1 glutamine amidotransferase domain-containing protein [Nonomuraea sp. NPDC050556]|uniref:type 1 glutamine amidotransferase domain-containing protein n=1 Tax=Nonomuraea sp. NPDC050556 TaxID=3364369 RepID=UPI00378C26F3